MTFKEVNKVSIVVMILVLLMIFPNDIFAQYIDIDTTNPIATTADPLIGRWERDTNLVGEMIINVTKKNDSYEAVIEKSTGEYANYNFKIGDIKWKEIKKKSNTTYTGKDLFRNKTNEDKYSYVDINISLSSDGNIDIKAIYKDGQKANMGEYQKWRKLKNNFNLTINSWPIQNTRTSYGYNFLINDYKIPLERYIEVFGESIKPYYKSMDKTWAGNCFGMSVSAAMHNLGTLELPNVTILTRDGYNDFRNTSILSIATKEQEPILTKGSELAKIIERYQIYGDITEDYRKESARSYMETLKNWDKVEPLLVNVYWSGVGHALITDTSRKIESLEDGYKRIYLYDPNYPYFMNLDDINLPDYYSKASERYIDINESTGDWRTNVTTLSGTKDNFVGRENGKAFPKSVGITGLELFSFNDLNIPRNFDGTAKFNVDKVDTRSCTLSTSNIVIKNSKNEILFEVTNGVLTTLSNGIKYKPFMGYVVCNDEPDSEKADNKIRATLTLPIDLYNVSMDDESNVIFLGNNKMNSIQSTGKIDFTINKENDTVDIISKEDTNISWVHQNIYSNDDYFAVSYDSELKMGDSIVSNFGKDNDLLISSESMEPISVSVDNGIEQKAYSNLSITDINNKNASNLSNMSINLTDIAEHWGKENIEYLIKKGGISGYPDGTFKPDKTISKSEFLKIALLSVTNEKYSPETNSHWATNIFDHAFSLKILNENEMPVDSWDEPINRYDMTMIMVRIIENILFESKTDIIGVENIIKDYDIVKKQEEYKYYVEQSFMKGLITGKDTQGTFDGESSGTRAEASTMITRMLEASKRVR